MPVWPGHPHFCQEVRSSLQLGDVSCWHAVSMGEHTGTHFDAPSHFVRKGRSISEAQLEKFFGRMVTIDAQGMEARAAVDPEKILAWEAEHGSIAPRDAVFFHFGLGSPLDGPPPRISGGLAGTIPYHQRTYGRTRGTDRWERLSVNRLLRQHGLSGSSRSVRRGHFDRGKLRQSRPPTADLLSGGTPLTDRERVRVSFARHCVRTAHGLNAK